MEIRKLFKYEMGHIVRKAWSRRCSKNAHGHSYIVEFLFDGADSDNGQMLTDFGFIKQYLHPYVDSFDHSFWLWNLPEDQHIVDFFKNNFERVLVSPFSTTAEMQAKLFFNYADMVMEYLHNQNKFENGETTKALPERLKVSAVRVHETTTGYAEYRRGTLDKFTDANPKNVWISDQIKSEWPVEFQTFYEQLTS